MKHIVSLSGGKDSTAMLLHMLELGMPIDEIHHFDVGNWDFPQVQRHINEVEKVIGIPIKRIKADHSLDYYFLKYKRKKGKKEGVRGYGFPGIHYRWCTRIKSQALNRETPKHGVIKYVGFDRKEARRPKMITMQKYYFKFPLMEWGWDGERALKYCYSRGFYWEGLYNYFGRTGCWCCPFQSIRELRNLRRYYPELWTRLKEMQEQSDEDYFVSGISVLDIDRKFEDEENHQFFKYKIKTKKKEGK